MKGLWKQVLLLKLTKTVRDIKYTSIFISSWSSTLQTNLIQHAQALLKLLSIDFNLKYVRLSFLCYLFMLINFIFVKIFPLHQWKFLWYIVITIYINQIFISILVFISLFQNFNLSFLHIFSLIFNWTLTLTFLYFLSHAISDLL